MEDLLYTMALVPSAVLKIVLKFRPVDIALERPDPVGSKLQSETQAGLAASLGIDSPVPCQWFRLIL